MAQVCAICGKKAGKGRQYKKLMSKYNPTLIKKKRPNIQWVRVPLGIKKEPFKKFAGKRVRMCSSCRRTMLKYL